MTQPTRNGDRDAAFCIVVLILSHLLFPLSPSAVLVLSCAAIAHRLCDSNPFN